MVKVEQIYTGCVAEAAYFIESEGECCVIDPLRELKPYTHRAEAAGAKLKYIFETHFHADFVSGHCDLAKLTGATIVYGPLAEPQFPAHVAKDGEVFKIGGATITVLHTPGHTMESTCYLLHDEQGKHAGVFTGDTLFIGDVGRPDLAQKAANLTTEQLAEHLFHSLRTKIMTLPDDITVYPGHGAGSACGKNLSSQTTDTLGHQKATNYALRANMTVEEFTKELLHGLTAPPSYFPLAVAKNKQAPAKSFDAIMHLARTRVSPQQLYKMLNGPNPPLVIDTRTVKEFCKSHIRGTVFTGIDDGSFAPWIATAVGNVDIPYVLVPSTDAKLKEAVTRLSRFGFDNPVGYLHGGFKAWLDAGYPTDSFETVSAEVLYQRLKADPNLYLVDVRNPGEWSNAHHPRAVSIRLNAPNLNDVDPSRTVYAHCRAGYRSCIFLSLVRRVHGPHVRVVNVEGGFDAIAAHPGLAKELVRAQCASQAKQQQACSAGATSCSNTPKSKL